MKIKMFGKETMLAVAFVLLFLSLVFAAEPQVVTIQGRIMDWDLKKNMIVVIERYFFWNAATLFYDEKGNAIKGDQFKAEQLKMNTLVNIEAVKKTTAKREFTIKKLYLPSK